MVRRNAFRWTLATLGLLGASTVSAGPINFTGNVAADFNKTVDPSISVVQVDADPLNRIIQLPQMTSQGIINGYAIKDIRESYDSSTDTLYVGLNTYSIAGNAVGVGGPTGAALNQILVSQGGKNESFLGGLKSITVGFAGLNPNDSTAPGAMVAVAGVPSIKPNPQIPGYQNFTVAAYNGNSSLQLAYGNSLPNVKGTLAFNPDAAHPGFEFSIKNFSQISPNLDPTKGFWIKAYAGSPNDNPIGEETTGFIHIPAFQQQTIPEPTTWLAWSLVATGAAGYRLRRREKN